MSPYTSLFIACLIGVAWASPVFFSDGMPIDTITVEIDGKGEARVSSPSAMQRSATGDTDEFFFDGSQSRDSDDDGPVQGFLMVKEGNAPMKIFPYDGSQDGRSNVAEAQAIPEEFADVFKIFNDPESPFHQISSSVSGRSANRTEQAEADDAGSEIGSSDDPEQEAVEEQ